MQLFSFLVTAPLLASILEVQAWSPHNSYTPANVTCPNDFNLIREGASSLSSNETEWLSRRDEITKAALKEFLQRATSNFTDSSIVNEIFGASNSSNSSNSTVSKLRVGIAASGGGYRAMLSGAGMVAAFDNRTIGANAYGFGGLLQGSTYLSGLSGGNWLTGTLAWNNWTSVQDIIDNTYTDNSIWDITDGLVSGTANNTLMWETIFAEVAGKSAAGYNTSLADYWGRGLAYNFFPNLPNGGSGYTWSTLRDSNVFLNAEMPFPITVTDARDPNTTISYVNSTIVEFNPFEMGSWDPSLNSFADVKYIGSAVNNGSPIVDGVCAAGFDNAGFIIGTSSTLFTPAMSSAVGTLLGNSSSTVGTFLVNEIAVDTNDVANFGPNPFYGSSFGISNIGNKDILTLADGGEDNIELPLIALIQKQRDLDVVFALDNSADTAENWPDGNGLISAYRRQFYPQGSNISFPYVPDAETFVSEGLNKRPTFFGCDAANLTNLAYVPPLIVYLPNYEVSYASNTSTLQLAYNETERLSMIQNGFEAVTRGNFTEDSKFLGCVACAVMRRSQESLGLDLPSECQSCFDTYCWDGSLSDSAALDSAANSTSTISSTSASNSTTMSISMTTSTSASSSNNNGTSASSNSTPSRSSTSSHNGATSLDVTTKITLVTVFIFNFLLGNF
ncbi:hypothetical protein TPHA_0F02460 [Tetrapisispora phaffii CBS 4417]|uniref:Lysophospholipase n=1 Tax=Tetrapisispora phaffii (strain ATCC 24235 / CBS 4417 / NBRC 1672 / NRRL Y-8282 / UCD 70-5) TaxID=1071381 RepID=G8BUE1_TETPH|nr:hypothetical protein TPHA_0F02460 [Tetrapisispora phaffii CBS 4417]CCE63727.1 hypothetical protein TPHA_0F02460 [Tetrapisispora phaffii CBS 4417]